VSSPRWPGWVYGTGEEPDYGFSFANERTLLAWLRTGLGLLAAGVAVDTFDLPFPDVAQTGLASLLVMLSMFAAGAAWVRRARAERAMRRREPLPSSSLALVLRLGVVLTAAVILLVELLA
jgi:putative membrane protein